MKKYFMPVLAVVLAIGFSAFTAPHFQEKTADPTLFWYFYDTNNDKLAGQIGDARTTHNNARSATTCTDYGMIECARLRPGAGSFPGNTWYWR